MGSQQTLGVRAAIRAALTQEQVEQEEDRPESCTENQRPHCQVRLISLSKHWTISYSESGAPPRKPVLKVKSHSPLGVWKTLSMLKAIPSQERTEREPSTSPWLNMGKNNTNFMNCYSRPQATQTSNGKGWKSTCLRKLDLFDQPRGSP